MRTTWGPGEWDISGVFSLFPFPFGSGVCVLVPPPGDYRLYSQIFTSAAAHPEVARVVVGCLPYYRKILEKNTSPRYSEVCTPAS